MARDKLFWTASVILLSLTRFLIFYKRWHFSIGIYYRDLEACGIKWQQGKKNFTPTSDDVFAFLFSDFRSKLVFIKSQSENYWAGKNAKGFRPLSETFFHRFICQRNSLQCALIKENVKELKSIWCNKEIKRSHNRDDCRMRISLYSKRALLEKSVRVWML